MVDMGAYAENSPVLSEDGNTRVGGSEIDTNSSGHFDGSFCVLVGLVCERGAVYDQRLFVGLV